MRGDRRRPRRARARSPPDKRAQEAAPPSARRRRAHRAPARQPTRKSSPAGVRPSPQPISRSTSCAAVPASRARHASPSRGEHGAPLAIDDTRMRAAAARQRGGREPQVGSQVASWMASGGGGTGCQIAAPVRRSVTPGAAAIPSRQRTRSPGRKCSRKSGGAPRPSRSVVGPSARSRATSVSSESPQAKLHARANTLCTAPSKSAAGTR